MGWEGAVSRRPVWGLPKDIGLSDSDWSSVCPCSSACGVHCMPLAIASVIVDCTRCLEATTGTTQPPL